MITARYIQRTTQTEQYRHATKHNSPDLFSRSVSGALYQHETAAVGHRHYASGCHHSRVLELSSCRWIRDRKSTRLNSSHVAISYAVFCLKKKRKLSSKLSRFVLDIY